MRLPASIPSPGEGVIHLGPLPIRGYAVAIILGIIVCVVMADRRWVARGGKSGTVADLAVWAVPAGLVGSRIYHVVNVRSPDDLTDDVKAWLAESYAFVD